MKYYDLHTHSTHSDGEASIACLVQTAAEKGYGLGVSDHLYCGGMDTLADIERYLKKLCEYPVLKGCEANIGEDYTLPDNIASKFDYVIASLHHITDFDNTRYHLGQYFGERASDAPNVHWKNPFDLAQSEKYLTEALPIIEHTMKTQRMDIYGHCNVLPFCEHLAGSSFLIDWEDELISLCKKYNIAIEISGLWKEPGLDMVLRAKAAGIKFTLGSDCHLIKDICNLDYAIDILNKALLTELDIKSF